MPDGAGVCGAAGIGVKSLLFLGYFGTHRALPDGSGICPSAADGAALIDALRSGHLGGAYLDVFETEPLPAESPLWTMPNVLVTPHASDNIVGWPRRFAELFADNLARWRAGEPLLNVVSP